MNNDTQRNLDKQKRIYASKVHDWEEEKFIAYKNTYTKVIPEISQYEHLKNRYDLCQDIFNHTEAKIKESTENLVRVYNKNFGCDMDNNQIKDVMQSGDMYFPLNFKFQTI